MPTSCNHLTVLFLAKILHTKTGYDFRFLATVPEIIYNNHGHSVNGDWLSQWEMAIFNPL